MVSEIVPDVVIGPPVRPAPVPTLVTVPAPYNCALTKAVVAIWVELSDETAVGAVGVPVKAGEARGAAPSIVMVCATVRSCGLPEMPRLLPLIVFVGIKERYELSTPADCRLIVPVVVIVPPMIGAAVAIDVTVPTFAARPAICPVVAL